MTPPALVICSFAFLTYVAISLTVGMLWWKALGLW